MIAAKTNNHVHRFQFGRVLTGQLLLLTACSVAPASSIFDDDWVPPPSSTPPATKPPVTTTKPPVDKPPVDKPPVDKPPVDKLPIDRPPITKTPLDKPPVVKLPVVTLPDPPSRSALPDHAAQAKSRKLMKEVFADQLRDTSPAGRRKLFRTLLDEARKVGGENPTDRFVLLTGAVEAGKDAADLRLCFEAADELSTAFEIDAFALRADAATKLPTRAYSIIPPVNSPLHAAANEAAAANLRAGLEVVDQLTALEDFTAASRLTPVLQQGASADPTLRVVVLKEAQAIEAGRTARQRYEEDSEKIKTAPDDPSANLSVGMYLCFHRNDWETGLPMLAKSSDTVIKGLAAAELAKPESADGLGKVADGWWTQAEKPATIDKLKMKQHASAIYGTVLSMDGVAGLRRVLMEKRVAEAQVSDAPETSSPKATGSRSIVYICDASGSMLSRFDEARKLLLQAVTSLKPSQTFNLIFFQEFNKVALSSRELLPANDDNKGKAAKFLEGVSPRAQTNPFAALDLAFSQHPQLIYLITDGDFDDNAAVIKWIADHNKDHAIKINTMALITSASEDPTKVLMKIASDNGGLFTVIKEKETRPR